MPVSVKLQEKSGTNTAGPRCYHFVIGGSTPAAQGAELVAAAFIEALAARIITLGDLLQVEFHGSVKTA